MKQVRRMREETESRYHCFNIVYSSFIIEGNEIENMFNFVAVSYTQSKPDFYSLQRLRQQQKLRDIFGQRFLQLVSRQDSEDREKNRNGEKVARGTTGSHRPRAPYYFTLSSLLFVSARPPALLIISLFLFISHQAQKRPLWKREVILLNLIYA